MANSGLTREELIVILAAMGMVLPGNTKIPDETLEKRLTGAFEFSQQIATHIKDEIVDPEKYPQWTRNPEKALLLTSQRGNLTEAFQGTPVMTKAKLGDRAPKEDIFKELRQDGLNFAYMYDDEIPEICFLDQEAKWGIYVRLLAVHEINEQTPLFLFFYRVLEATPQKSLEDLHKMFKVDSTYATVGTSDLERRSLLKLFQQNAEKLHPRYQELNEREPAKQLGLHASFLLPLCPLDMKTLGKLTHNPGCDVCGKKDGLRCTQCLSANYCSKECQRDDWKSHRTICKNLKGGTWTTIPIEGMPYENHSPGDKGPFRTAMFNRLDSLQPRADDVEVDGGPPQNIHDDKVFLIKMQLPLGGVAQHVMIYDRQRSFSLFWMRKTNPQLFAQAERMMANKLKIYRWAKRVGDWQLSVCFDRVPEDPLW